MFCSKCGKKITDDMLFCPFCGSAVVIPEQEEPGPARQEAPLEQDDAPEEEIVDIEPFEPLDFDDTLRRFPPRERAEQAPKKKTQSGKEALPKSPELSGKAPELGSGRRSQSTYTPRREFDPDDLFLEDREPVEEEELYEFEEPERGSFFMRHIRGLIAFIMLMVLLLCMGIWLVSPQGQRFLARTDLAWTAEPYADVAHQSYDEQAYLQAAIYYEKAFARAPQQAIYATDAAICYVWAQNNEKAEQLARKAIAVDPMRTDAYQVLLSVYPDPATRPADVSALIRDGYARTHDPSLNI